MHYRPLGRSGMALSAIGLEIGHQSQSLNGRQISAMVVAALECGINCFHILGLDTALLDQVGAALAHIDRSLLYISVAILSPGQDHAIEPYNLTTLREQLKHAIRGTGLQYLDLLMFTDPAHTSISNGIWAFLDHLREARLVRAVGLDAASQMNSDHIRDQIIDGRFQVLRTDFSLDTSWDRRHLMSLAVKRGISILGKDYFPEPYRQEHLVVPNLWRRKWFFFRAKEALDGVGTYAFLYRTPGWTAEELCLAYALYQSDLASIHICPTTIKALQALSEVPGRHLPPSVPAQIEMARFNVAVQQGREKRA